MKDYLDIGVDLDGVCYDFVGALRHYLVTHEGFPEYDLGESTSWNFFKDNWNMSTSDFLKFFAAGVDAGIVFIHGEAMEGCAETITRLRERGHKVHIVTHRSVGTLSVASTDAWLRREGIPFDTLCFSEDKTIVKTDIFIEDKVENFCALERAGVDAVLMNQKWNAHHPTQYRVNNWKEFGNFVDARAAVYSG
jgi:5'(3')-deoxyribonucleotidase